MTFYYIKPQVTPPPIYLEKAKECDAYEEQKNINGYVLVDCVKETLDSINSLASARTQVGNWMPASLSGTTTSTSTSSSTSTSTTSLSTTTL